MKIVQKGPLSGNIITTVLQNRIIADVELFLNPDNSTDSDPYKFSNAKEALDLLLYHMKEKDKIAILVDQDADGYMSASLMYQYLKAVNDKADIQYIIHDTKAHGLTDRVMGKIKEINPQLILIPDAGSNDTSKIELLEENGHEVIVIDHHQVTNFTESGIIVNNQLCDHTNKNLVGVGVVYKFLQLLDEEYGYGEIDRYLDLVAVGQIGDSSNIADNEIRNMVLRGIDHIYNPFLKVAIGQKNGLGVQLSPRDLSFGVIPLINAVARVGEPEEREILFKALSQIDDGTIYPVVKKKKNKETGKFDNITFNFNLYEYAYDVTTKCKARQDAAVKKMVAHLENSVVDDAGIIVAFTEDNENPGITGLVANKLLGKYDKPVLLLNEQEETFTGSGRGHTKTIADFRRWCEDSELVEFAQGHNNAFGICIRKDKLDKFKEYSRNIKKQDIIYEVDVIYDRLSKEDCELVDNNKRLWGGQVSEPFIGIKGLKVPKKFISVKGSMLTIFSYGVSCVLFNASPEIYKALMHYPGDYVEVDMVGCYSINNWDGRLSPQFIIKDIEIPQTQVTDEVTVDTIVF